MEIGGLMAYTFKVFLGNPDIMMTLIVWAMFTGIILTVIRVYQDLTGTEGDA